MTSSSVRERKRLTKQLAQSSAAFFAAFYLGEHLKLRVPDFHKEIYQLLTEEERLVIAAPRSFGKSFVCSFFFPLYAALYEQKKDILLISGTGTLAEDWLAKIKNELDNNQMILADFGYQKSRKWTQSHIRLRNGCEIRAKGRGYQIRGFRPDLVIADDLEDDELVSSKLQREKLNDWFWKALMGTLAKDGQIVVIGTILHPVSFLAKLLLRKEWTAKRYTALDEDGESIWSEHKNKEWLLKERKRSPEAFMSEYMNAPLVKHQANIDEKKLKDNLNMPPLDQMIRFSAVDPAISKRDRADKTAIVTMGVSQREEDRGHIYTIDSRQDRWTVYETIKEIIKVHDAYQPQHIGIEETAYQKALLQVATKETRARNIFLPLLPLKSDRDKVRRANKVSYLIDQGLVHMDKDKDDAELFEQLILFSSDSADFDDLADAFFYALDMVVTYSAGSSVSTSDKTMAKLSEDNIYLDSILRQGQQKKKWYNY